MSREAIIVGALVLGTISDYFVWEMARSSVIFNLNFTMLHAGVSNNSLTCIVGREIFERLLDQDLNFEISYSPECEHEV